MVPVPILAKNFKAESLHAAPPRGADLMILLSLLLDNDDDTDSFILTGTAMEGTLSFAITPSLDELTRNRYAN